MLRPLLIAACAVLVITSAALPQEPSLPPAHAALVAAERAFAKLGAERGVRESFLTWFADDAIAFYPQPMRAKDKLSKDPVETLPLPYTLHWVPVYGEKQYLAESAAGLQQAMQKRVADAIRVHLAVECFTRNATTTLHVRFPRCRRRN